MMSYDMMYQITSNNILHEVVDQYDLDFKALKNDHLLIQLGKKEGDVIFGKLQNATSQYRQFTGHTKQHEIMLKFIPRTSVRVLM